MLVAAILLTFTSLAVAQSKPGAAGAVSTPSRKPLSEESLALRDAGWRDFLKRNGEGFTVVYETDSTLPHWILAPGVSVGTPPLDAGTVHASAVSFIQANEAFFGTTAVDLVGTPELRGDVWAMNFSLIEPQSTIPFDRWSSVNVRCNDRVGALSAIVFNRIPLAIEPAEISVDFGVAVTAAMGALPPGVTDVAPGPSSLEYVVNDDGLARVAWRFTIRNADTHSPYQHDFWVGARGMPDVLRDWDDVGTVDLSGTVNGRGHAFGPTSALSDLPLPNLLVSIPDGDKAFTDSDGKYRIENDGSTAVTVVAALSGRFVHVREYDGYDLSSSVVGTPGTPCDFLFNDADGPETSTSQVDAYAHANAAHDAISATVGATYIDSVLDVYVNLPQTCNSYYSHQTRSMYCYEGGDECRNAAYDTVVIHEYGHFFDDMTGGILDWGLSEGLSDMIATFVTGQPLIGESFYMDGRPVRDADNDATYPADRCWGEVHCEGETFSGFAWHTRANLMATLGDVVGADLASEIFFNAIAMNPHCERDAVLDVYLQDDDDGNPMNGTPHCTEIEAASARHGYDAVVNVTCEPPVYLTVFPLPAETRNSVEPYRVTATATESTQGSWDFGSVDLFYSIDGGAIESVPMLPTANAGEYAGLIPSQPCVARIRYWVRATDDLMRVVVQPPGAPSTDLENTFQTLVATLKPSLANDAESGEGGFMDHATVGLGDWAIRSFSEAQSGTHAWFSSDPPNEKDDSLVSPSVTLAERSTLTFWQSYSLERRFDGGVLEISTDDGATWTDLGAAITDGGYDSTLSYWSPLPGRRAWTGGAIGPMTRVTVDLGAYSGDVRIRWRLVSDSSVPSVGWYVDDVAVTSVECLPFLTISDENPPLGSVQSFTVLAGALEPIDLLLGRGIGSGDVTPTMGGIARTDLGSPVRVRATGMTDTNGSFQVTRSVPNRSRLAGHVLFMQAIAADENGWFLPSNVLRVRLTPQQP